MDTCRTCEHHTHPQFHEVVGIAVNGDNTNLVAERRRGVALLAMGRESSLSGDLNLAG